jgi:hypothetical protein
VKPKKKFRKQWRELILTLSKLSKRLNQFKFIKIYDRPK